MAELDIFTDTTADDTTSDSSAVYDAGMFAITDPLQGADYTEAEAYYYGDTYIGEDGFRYNADGERVYRYKPAGEGGKGKYGGTDFGKNDESEIYGDIGFYTEAQIRELWDAGSMGNTTDQFDSFEDYMAYIQAVDEFRSNPEYQATYDRKQEIARAGLENGLSPSEIQAQIDAELGEAISSYEAEWQGIRQSYGVDDIIRTDNGDVYKWNGYAYVKTYKTPQAGFMDYMKMAAVVGAGYLLGGPLANALGGGALGAAGASGIINAAQQLVLTGKLDWKEALMQAAQAGLTTAAWNQLKQSGKLEEVADWVAGLGEDTTTIRDAAGNVLTAAEIEALGGDLFIEKVFKGLADGYTGVVTGWNAEVPDWIVDVLTGVEGVSDVIGGATGGVNEQGDYVFGAGFPQPEETTPPPEDQPPPEQEEQEEQVEQVEDNVDEVVDPGTVDEVVEEQEEVVDPGTVDEVVEEQDEVVGPGYTGETPGPDPVGESEKEEDEIVDPGVVTPSTPTSSGSSSSTGMLAANQFDPFRAGITYAPTLPAPLPVAAPKDFVTPLLTPKKYQGSVKSLFQDYLA